MTAEADARLEGLRLRALENRIDAELPRRSRPQAGDIEMPDDSNTPIRNSSSRNYFPAPCTRRSFSPDRRSTPLDPAASDARRRTRHRPIAWSPARGTDPPPGSSPREGVDPPTNLPADQQLIGRADELSLLEQLIRDHRLVTVTGPGGAGRPAGGGGRRRVAGNSRTGFGSSISPVDTPGALVTVASSLGAPLLQEQAMSPRLVARPRTHALSCWTTPNSQGP